jgi:DNA repair exonuclease SbcCD ATPase subunit
MIHFETVRWKNFLSTGNVWTEVQFTRSPTTLIVGDNGSGKSTLLDALCFGLFGKAFRKINKQQLVNSINGKGAAVEVEFTIGSHRYKIYREIKKYGSSPFEVFMDDKLVNQPGSARDYQAYLEEAILKVNFTAFTQIVILGNASFTPFMQLPSMQRREIIEELLDIKIFTAMNNILKEKQDVNKESVSTNKHNTQLASEKLYIYKKNRDKVNNDVKSKLDMINQRIVESESKINAHETVAADLLSQISTDLISISDEEDIVKRLDKIGRLESTLEDKIRRVKKEKAFFEQNSVCPTCDQDISDEVRTNRMDVAQNSISETETGLTKLESEFTKAKVRQDNITAVQESVRVAQIEVAKQQSEISAQRNYVKGLELDLQQATEETSKEDDNSVQIKTLETAISKLNKEQEKLQTEKHLLETASNLLKDKGIKARIINQYVPVINKLVNKYLAAMDFFVKFELNENFEEVIRSRHRDDFSYSSFSEGEKMRIDLALLFTWRSVAKMKNSVNTNLLILDEVFDASLDTGGCDEFLKIIDQLGDGTNVFVISHKGDILQDKFRSMIKFEKHKDFSRIAA